MGRFESVLRVQKSFSPERDTLKYVFAYNADGTVKLITEFYLGDTIFQNIFVHTASYSVRFGRLFSPPFSTAKTDSLRYDEKGRPVEVYMDDKSQPDIQYTYGSNGRLEFTRYPFGSSPQIAKNYFENGDLVQTDTGERAVLYTYYTNKTVQLGDVKVFEHLLWFGKVWAPNVHLLKSEQQATPQATQYSYSFADGRITQLAITNPNLLYTYLFSYQK